MLIEEVRFAETSRNESSEIANLNLFYRSRYLAFWSELASAFAAQVHSLCASMTSVYLSSFVLGGGFN